MLENYCKHLAVMMCENDLIKQTNVSTYAFELQMMIEAAIVHFFLLLFFTIVRDPVGGLMFIVSFGLLRAGTGGFHCKTNIGCIAMSFMVSIYVFSSKELCQKYLLLYQGVVALSIIIILLSKPINHPNMNWSDNELFHAKRYVLILVSILIVILFSLEILNADFSLEYYLSSGFIQCAISILIAKIIGQEVKNDEG